MLTQHIFTLDAGNGEISILSLELKISRVHGWRIYNTSGSPQWISVRLYSLLNDMGGIRRCFPSRSLSWRRRTMTC